MLTYPPIAKARVIVNTDAKNEADDQFAIAQAMCSPSFDVRGIIAAHFGNRPGRGTTTMLDSKAEVELILDLLGMAGTVPVLEGSPTPLIDFRTPADSPGARLIIEESKRDADGPLYLVFLGPLTDMASALILDPDLASRDVIVVWIGGGDYDNPMSPPGRMEFNLSNDIAAANVVFASGVRVWQIPLVSYLGLGISYAQLLDQVAPLSPLGEYLVSQLFEWNGRYENSIEYRALCDCGAVAVVLNPWCGQFEELPARRFEYDGTYGEPIPGVSVRVYRSLDSSFVLGDLLAKLRLHAKGVSV